jgi:hypothetical protein
MFDSNDKSYTIYEEKETLLNVEITQYKIDLKR